MADVNKILGQMFWGLLAGLASAVGGAIKDAPYEGFEGIKFIRSPIIGAVEAPILAHFLKIESPPVLFLSTLAAERITVESYKLARAVYGGYMPMKFIYGEWGIPPEERRKLRF